MSEIHPPSTDRWIPGLGAALLVEAMLTAAAPAWREPATDPHVGFPYLSLLTGGLLPAAVGAHMLVCHKRDSFPGLSLRLAFAAIVGLVVTVAVQMLSNWSRGSTVFIFQPLSMLLAGIGVPILWGSALARHQDPGRPELQKFGRVAAGLVQLSFVFEFVVRSRSWSSLGILDSNAGPATAALVALSSLADIAGSLVLLWASVEAMRAVPDAAVVVRRARRTHRLMTCWICLFPVQVMLLQGSLMVQHGPAGGPAVRMLAVMLTAIVMYATLYASTSFVLARWLRLQFPASISPLARSGGVESTGEPT